jgi:hypothetical protein
LTCFLEDIGTPSTFFAASGVGMRNTTATQAPFRFRRAAFHFLLTSKVGKILAKAAALRISAYQP